MAEPPPDNDEDRHATVRAGTEGSEIFVIVLTCAPGGKNNKMSMTPIA